MAKTKKTKQEEIYFEDEIDLTPYINRVLARKWWIAGAVVVTAVIAYGASYFMPKKYKVNASLTFSGEETTVINEEAFTQEPAIASTYVNTMVDEFTSQLKSNGEEVGLESINVEGKAYPLTIEITVGEGVDKTLYHNQLLSYLNNNKFVSDQVDAEKTALENSIADYTSSIESIDSEINRIENQLDKGNDVDADVISTYAILISTREGLLRQKQALESAKDQMQGFTYVVKPYFLNNGNPVSPKKIQNAGVAGFGMLAVAGGIAAFKEERKDKKKSKKK